MDENRRDGMNETAEQTEQNAQGNKPSFSVTPRVVLIFSVCVALLMIFLNIESVRTIVNSLFGMLAPVLIGLTIAYIINPLYKFFERKLAAFMEKRGKTPAKKIKRRARGWGLFLAVFLMLAIIITLLFLIIPEFIDNVQILLDRIPGLIRSASKWLRGLIVADGSNMSPFIANIADFIDGLGENLTSLITGDAFKDIISAATNGVISLASYVINFIIALVVCVYALLERDKFIGQTKKLVFSIFPAERANEILTVSRYGNDVFGKFLTGKLLTSAADGVIMFILMSIAGIPYALLSSVIIAITNIIPFFGPFIGGGITGFIILITDPKKGLIFLIMFVILMQIDGNIISPMILEDRTGVSKFWVTFALLLFGGLFGIAGMFFAVPLFAVLYYCIKVLVERRLVKKGLPVESGAYFDAGGLDPVTNKFIPAPEKIAVKKPRLSFRAVVRAFFGKKLTDEDLGTDRSNGKKDRIKKDKK